MAAPPAMPCSASKLLLTIFTVSTASTGGRYATRRGSHGWLIVAPSSLVLLLDWGMPLACVTMDRCGLPESECASTGGVNPGSTLYNSWKLRPCELISGRFVICVE